MTVREALKITEGRLRAVSDEAATEAEILLEHVTGRGRAGIRLSNTELSRENEAALDAEVERRLAREPLQYILGEWYFMGLPFEVAPAALIPRQDTETLCEEALRLITERGYKSLLDICTGTGCIAVSLLKLSGIWAEATDISSECAALAERNAKRNGVGIFARMADLFNGAGKYDIVTANPPYITDADMASLQEEVRHEPRLALAGGPDGLDFYRRIAAEAAEHVNPGGALLLEVGYNEAEAVAELFRCRESAVIRDLNGIERVVRIDY